MSRGELHPWSAGVVVPLFALAVAGIPLAAVPVACLGGAGYTVSLLVSALAAPDVAAQERSAAAVVCGSLLASLVGVVLLRRAAGGCTAPADRSRPGSASLKPSSVRRPRD